MYKIEAIVRPDRLGFVKEALVDQGFEEFAVTEVHGHGSQPGPAACYRGVSYEIPFAHQALVELSVADTALDAIVDCIVDAAHTGQPGDGKIFVAPLEEVVEIGVEAPVVAQSRPNPRPRLAATADAAWPSAWSNARLSNFLAAASARSPRLGRAPKTASLKAGAPVMVKLCLQIPTAWGSSP